MSQANPFNRGYIFVQLESYGFDDDVFLIVQRHGMFEDYSASNPTNPYAKIYRVNFGDKFYIPAEYDILIAFEPVKSDFNTRSPLGKLRLRTWLQSSDIAVQE